MRRVKGFVGPHDGNQVLGVAQVDNVMGIAGQHMYRLDMFAANLKVEHFIGTHLPLLDEPVAADHHEELPLGMVPMLAFGDAGLGDVHTHLPTFVAAKQLRKGATVIHVHFQGKGRFLLG